MTTRLLLKADHERTYQEATATAVGIECDFPACEEKHIFERVVAYEARKQVRLQYGWKTFDHVGKDFCSLHIPTKTCDHCYGRGRVEAVAYRGTHQDVWVVICSRCDGTGVTH